LPVAALPVATRASAVSSGQRASTRLGCAAGSGSISESVVYGICFHGIGTPRRPLEAGEEPYWVSVDTFHAILDTIVEIPAVEISFDDGNASDVDIALPALLQRELSASFFVVAGRIGAPGSLDRDALRELDRRGMTIGSHGMDHRPWRHLSPVDRDRELVEARRELAAIIGRPMEEAALPTGAYDRRLLKELERLEYRAVHTSDRRPGASGAWLRPRFSVVASDTSETVRDYARLPSRARRARLSTKAYLKRLR
jgi:peptidoglycan/xylan/chitin deacetylase (PgdA/CDA1 family)